MTSVGLLGLLLLLLLLWDVTVTLFPPYGSHGGPVHRRQGQLVWSTFRRLSRVVPTRARAAMLSFAGPCAVVAALASWSLWLVTGFALLYVPALDSFSSAASPGPAGLIDAFYYSGYVATTLGLGDVVATTPILRLATVLEAMAGFGLFAVSTTYVLTIAREVARTGVLAEDIASLRELLERISDDGDEKRTARELLLRRMESWAMEILRAANTHTRYPLVHYFRPVESDRSLLVQVGWLMAITESELETRPTPAGPTAPATATGRLLRQSLERYLVRLNRGCLPSSFDPLSIREAPPERLLGRLLRHMSYDAHSPPGRTGS